MSNCFVWAVILFRRHYCDRWYLTIRKSDKGWFPHFGVGRWSEERDAIRSMSRKPPHDAPHRVVPPLCHDGWTVWGDPPPHAKDGE